jgi:hypothetical protein
MRLADANGYMKASSFWSAIRKTLDKANIRHFNLPDNLSNVNPYLANKSSSLRIKALHYISTLTNQEPLPLLSLAIFRSANHYCDNSQAVIQNGKSLPRKFVNNFPPVCPDCLKESNYIRQIWSFSPYKVCHVHSNTLVNVCLCGRSISVYSDQQLGFCPHCNTAYTSLKSDSLNENDLIISSWLAGYEGKGLPKVSQSHKYGLIIWWLKLKEINLSEFIASEFYDFFSNWPVMFHEYLGDKWAQFNEFGTKPINEARFKDAFNQLLIISAKLPSARFNENIILSEIFSFFDHQMLCKNNGFLSLKVNSIEAAMLLNTSTEQIAALVDLGELKSHVRVKSGQFLNLYQYAFELGDLYCLWQSGCQTEYSNISMLTSRW